jgi:nanoRNase/pAp phosphatase (c-di-AMP/oligoRNAs hydrolase)
VKALKNLEKLFEIGINFIKGLRKGEKTILVYDTDVDGVASAVLLLSAIEEMGKKVMKTFPLGFGDMEKSKAELRRFEKIITVDVPIDLIEKHLLDLGKDMLIIDHHPGNDLNSDKVVMINPRIENSEIYQPTSYVVYKMFKKMLEEKKWVSILGTVGDLGIDDCRDLVRIKDKKNVWKSKFGKASMLLAAHIAIFGPERAFRILSNSRSLKELVENQEIISASREFNQELERCEREFKKNLEAKGKILISKIKPRYKGVCSVLITRLATENPEKIIFVFEDKLKSIRIHGRNSLGKVNIGRFFKELGIGGGHEEAGAGNIDKKDEEKLKLKILSKLKSFSV